MSDLLRIRLECRLVGKLKIAGQIENETELTKAISLTKKIKDVYKVDSKITVIQLP